MAELPNKSGKETRVSEYFTLLYVIVLSCLSCVPVPQVLVYHRILRPFLAIEYILEGSLLHATTARLALWWFARGLA